MNDFTSHNKAISDINRMLDHINEPIEPIIKISPAQRYWQDQAEILSLSLRKSMAVVKVDTDNYQVWPLSKVGNDFVYVAEYMDGGGADGN